MIRCAAYCRVSSDSEDQINSFMAQLKYYENFFADSETETLINVYADEGVTGTCEDKVIQFTQCDETYNRVLGSDGTSVLSASFGASCRCGQNVNIRV